MNFLAYRHKLRYYKVQRFLNKIRIASCIFERELYEVLEDASLPVSYKRSQLDKVTSKVCIYNSTFSVEKMGPAEDCLFLSPNKSLGVGTIIWPAPYDTRRVLLEGMSKNLMPENIIEITDTYMIRR